MRRLLHRMVTAWLRRYLLRRMHPYTLHTQMEYQAHPDNRDQWVGLYWDVTPYWANAYVCLRPGYVHHWRWPVVRLKRGAETVP